MSKPRVAFLFSGQSRTNMLSLNPTNHSVITDSWDKYIFHADLKEAYDYDVFITSDNMDIDKTFAYFGQDHVKNIHLLDIDWYLHRPTTVIPDINIFMSLYTTPNGYQRYPNIVNQSYKMYDCLNLMKHSDNHYDYIVRMRFDIVLHHNIKDCLDRVASGPVELIDYSEMCIIGKYDIMCWVHSLLLHNGKYNQYKNRFLGWPVARALPDDYHRWKYSHEAQASEHIRNYYKDKDVEEKVLNMDLSRLMRRDGRLEDW
jgi:hypothetical protein